MKKGDSGINELDKACKQHDIIYSGPKRRAADEILAKTAWNRFKSSNATFGEKLSALGVAGIMKAKTKLGLGIGEQKMKSSKRSSKKKRSSKIIPMTSKKVLTNAIKDAKNILTFGKPTSVDEASKLATYAALAAVRKHKISKKMMKESILRVIPVPKVGGMLPLIPVFAGLSALGALMGGAANVRNAVVAAKDAHERLNEANRHNKIMGAIAIGQNKSGDGVYLKPYRKGLGVYLKPYMNSKNR